MRAVSGFGWPEDEALGRRLSETDDALLDLNMPEVDGIELARSITADATLRYVRMVLLTSPGHGGDGSQAPAVGIGGYQTKSVRQSELYDCLGP